MTNKIKKSNKEKEVKDKENSLMENTNKIKYEDKFHYQNLL